jgi:hypothetical protein
MRKSGLSGLFVLVSAAMTVNCSSGNGGETVSDSQGAVSQAVAAGHEKADQHGGDDDRDHEHVRCDADDSCSITRISTDVFDLTFSETHNVDGGRLSLVRNVRMDASTHQFQATSRLALNGRQIYLSSVDTKTIDQSFHAHSTMPGRFPARSISM